MADTDVSSSVYIPDLKKTKCLLFQVSIAGDNTQIKRMDVKQLTIVKKLKTIDSNISVHSVKNSPFVKVSLFADENCQSKIKSFIFKPLNSDKCFLLNLHNRETTKQGTGQPLKLGSLLRAIKINAICIMKSYLYLTPVNQ